GQPERAPEFDLENVAGGRTKSVEIQAQVLVLDFWATWAKPSNAEIPNLNKLHEAFNGRGLQVTAIAASSGTAKDIESKVIEFGVKYPVLVADNKVTDAFGIVGCPTTIVLTRDGGGWRIFKRYLGSSPGRIERMQWEIEALLSER